MGEHPGGPVEEIREVPESLPSSGDSSGHAGGDHDEIEGTEAEVKFLAGPGPGRESASRRESRPERGSAEVPKGGNAGAPRGRSSPEGCPRAATPFGPPCSGVGTPTSWGRRLRSRPAR